MKKKIQQNQFNVRIIKACITTTIKSNVICEKAEGASQLLPGYEGMRSMAMLGLEHDISRINKKVYEEQGKSKEEVQTQEYLSCGIR